MTAIRVLSVGFLWLINLFPQPEDIVVWQKGYNLVIPIVPIR